VTKARCLWLLLAALLGAGCQQAPVPDGKPLVVASFYPMYEFARQVAGERAQVISLVPPGVHGHDWEPSPQDVAQVRRARVFVYNGAGFEQVADRLLKEIAGGGPLAVNATAGISLLEAPGEARAGRHRPDGESAEGHGDLPRAPGQPAAG